MNHGISPHTVKMGLLKPDFSALRRSLYVSACSNEKMLSVAEVAELTVSRLSQSSYTERQSAPLGARSRDSTNMGLLGPVDRAVTVSSPTVNRWFNVEFGSISAYESCAVSC